MNYRLIGYDEGRQNLLHIDTGRPGEGWTLSLAELPLARDLQRLGGGLVLVGFDRGFFEVEAATGRVVRVVDRWSGVTSVRRQPDGTTLVVGLDLAGLRGIVVLTVDERGEVEYSARREGSYVRLLRTTPEGTWLLGSDDHFLETDTALNEVRRLAAPGFRHAWMAHRFQDGRTLVSGGYGAFFAVFDAAGRVERTFGGPDQVPEAAPHFYASFEVLPSGGVLVANWQGHGPDQGALGRQLVEFDARGRCVDTWSDKSRISSLQGILLLAE